MKFIQCERRHYDMMFAFYRRVTEHLQNTVNYPEWSEKHPSADDLKGAISRGELYACLDKDELVGGVVLSEDPEGDYTLGRWKQQMDPGEFVTIHLLAVNPALLGRGIGDIAASLCACGILLVLFRELEEKRVPGIRQLAFIGRYSIMMLCAHIIELNLFPWYKLQELLMILGIREDSCIYFIIGGKLIWSVVMTWILAHCSITRRIFGFSPDHEKV